MDLIDAAQNGDLNVVRNILGKGTEIDAKDSFGASALFRASIWVHTDIVKLLIEKGADIDAEDHNEITALTHASSYGHADIENMLKAGKSK